MTAGAGNAGGTPSGGRGARAAAMPAGGLPRGLRILAPWPLAAIAVSAFALVTAARMFLGADALDPMSLGLTSIAVLVPALVAGLAGAALRRAHVRRESAWIDAATGLYNLDGLETRGDDLLARCRRQGRPLTLVAFDCSDLLEVRDIYGERVAASLGLRVAARLARIAGERGLAARTDVTDFAVLLPGLDRDRALRAVQRVLGSPPRVEYESGRSEIVVLPNLVLRDAGDEDDISGLRRAAAREMATSREYEERRQRYLRRERERHSSAGHSEPMPFSAHYPLNRSERAAVGASPQPFPASFRIPRAG